MVISVSVGGSMKAASEELQFGGSGEAYLEQYLAGREGDDTE